MLRDYIIIISLLWLNLFFDSSFPQAKDGQRTWWGERGKGRMALLHFNPPFSLILLNYGEGQVQNKKASAFLARPVEKRSNTPLSGIQHYSWKPLVTTSWLYLSAFWSTGLGHFITQHVTLGKHFLQDWHDSEKRYANNSQAQISEGQLRRWVMKGFGRFWAWAVH